MTKPADNANETYFPQPLVELITQRAHEDSLSDQPHIATSGRFAKHFFPALNSFMTAEWERNNNKPFSWDARNNLISAMSYEMIRHLISFVISFSPNDAVGQSLKSAQRSFMAFIDSECIRQMALITRSALEEKGVSEEELATFDRITDIAYNLAISKGTLKQKEDISDA